MTEEFTSCEGGCTCGQVRYNVEIAPLIVHACHCSWCQRQTGGPHAINAIFEAEFVELTQGEVETTTVLSPSGNGQIIARCPNCKVAVWSNYYFGGMGERLRFLRVGTLDDPARMPPDVHIYTSTKLPWVIIPPDHQVEDEYYDMRTTWSKQNLKRYITWKRATE